MKQLRWIWALGIAAVVLIGIFIIVDINSDKKDKAKHIGDGKQLLQFDESKATRVTLKNEEGTFSFEWDDADRRWVQTGGDEIHVNSYAIGAIVSYACHLESLKTVAPDSSSKNVYGFTNPVEIQVFTTETGDKHPYQIFVGDNTPTYDAYYAMIGGSDSIYTIDYNSGSVFCASKNALKNAYLFDTTAAQVQYIRIEKAGAHPVEIQRDSERAWQIVQPVGFNPAKAYVDDLADEIVHLTVESFVAENPADLAQYGLDKPQAKVWLKGTDGSTPLEEELWFGKPVSDSENETNLYGMFTSTRQVFTITKSQASFTNTTVAELVMPFCVETDIDNVDTVTIDMGSVYDLKATLGVDNANSAYQFNGTDISGLYDENLNKLFMNLYRAISNLSFTEIALDEKPDPKAEPVITIVYTFKDHTKKTLTFTEKSANNYWLFTDGAYSNMTVRLNEFTKSLTPSYETLIQVLKDKGIEPRPLRDDEEPTVTEKAEDEAAAGTDTAAASDAASEAE